VKMFNSYNFSKFLVNLTASTSVLIFQNIYGVSWDYFKNIKYRLRRITFDYR